MIDLEMKDEWGGIDPGIKTAVGNFNLAGLCTSGSCEGHADKRNNSPVPWVSIRIENEPEHPPASEEILENWKARIRELRSKIDRAIENFYKERGTSEKFRVCTRMGKIALWIACDRDEFARWRDEIDLFMAKKEKGEPYSKSVPTEEEKAEREKNLPIYRKEMSDFSEFLKERRVR